MHFSTRRLNYDACLRLSKRLPCPHCGSIGKFDDNQDQYDPTFLCLGCGWTIDVCDLIPDHLLFPDDCPPED